MISPFPKPLEQMTEAEVRVWKDWLMAEGSRSRPFAWGRVEGTLKLWDLDSRRELRALIGHKSAVYAVAVTPDGRRAVAASWDHTLKLWDLDFGRALRTFIGHTGTVSAVALTLDGRRAISASWDQTLKLWDLDSGREIRTLIGHVSMVTAVALTPDGRRAVSASTDGTLKLWDLDSGREIRTLEGLAGWVYAVVVTPDGRLISASTDGTIQVRRLADPVSESEYDYEPALKSVIERSADGKRYIVGVRNSELQRLRELTGEGRPGLLPGLRPLTSR